MVTLQCSPPTMRPTDCGNFCAFVCVTIPPKFADKGLGWKEMENLKATLENHDLFENAVIEYTENNEALFIGFVYPEPAKARSMQNRIVRDLTQATKTTPISHAMQYLETIFSRGI